MKICLTCLVVICLSTTTWFGYRHLLAGEPAAPAAGDLMQPTAVPPDQPAEARENTTPVGERAMERENPALLALRQEVHGLRDELNTLKQTLATDIATLRKQMATAPSVARDPHYLPPEMAHELARETRRQAMDAVENNFFQQTVDGEWSITASDAIFQGFMETDLPASVGADVECRATLCRVELISEDSAAIDGWLPQLSAEVSDILPGMSTMPLDLAGEPSGVVIYFTRDGHELPGATD